MSLVTVGLDKLRRNVQPTHAEGLAISERVRDSFKLIRLPSMDHVREHIRVCEGKHMQQVAYSTFHDGITQLCFGCCVIRTSIGGRPEAGRSGNGYVREQLAAREQREAVWPRDE